MYQNLFYKLLFVPGRNGHCCAEPSHEANNDDGLDPLVQDEGGEEEIEQLVEQGFRVGRNLALGLDTTSNVPSIVLLSGMEILISNYNQNFKLQP